MGTHVRIERDDADRLIAVKTARPGSEAALAREAAVLRRIRMPGVVELIDGADHDEATLVTRWVGPRSIADLEPPVMAERAAGLCLAVAATVARLHQVGVVHGAIEPAHVLLDVEGRPVLCGFGSAAPISEARRTAEDVAGLGRLLLHLLSADGGTRSDSRAPRRADRNRRRALLAAAGQASADDPSCRPSVAAFVHSIRRSVPDARLRPEHTRPPQTAGQPDRRADASAPTPRTRSAERRTDPTQPPRSRPVRPAGRTDQRRSSRPVHAGLGVVAMIVAAATAYFGLTAWGSPSAPSAPASRTSPSATTSTPSTTRAAVAPSTITSPTPSTTPSPPTTVAAPTATPDATATGGPVVEHLGRRYEVGQAGDVAAVGPWFCDGNDVVALLRPASGSVQVFTGWAPDQGTVDAEEVTTVPGASSLSRVSDGPGCAVLVVDSSSGPLRTLTAEDLR